MSTTTYTALGRLLACIDQAVALTRTAMGNCLTNPRGELLGRQLSRAMPILRRHPDLDARVAEIMEDLTPEAVASLPHGIPLTCQGDMLIVYYVELPSGSSTYTHPNREETHHGRQQQQPLAHRYHAVDSRAR